MIRSVRIRGFKRFADAEVPLPGHVVLAGPNNTGKTTVLQAIAAWDLALRRWRALDDYRRYRGRTWRWAPMTRQDFAAVPLRNFDLLWTDLGYRTPIEIGIRHDAGQPVTIELRRDSTEQISVRPHADTCRETLETLDLKTAFIPAMTGVGIEEPVYRPAMIERLLGLGRPGEALRNLLAEAHADRTAWESLCETLRKLFGYELLPPDPGGAYIRAEYRTGAGAPRLDIASAGMGFQQALLLFAFLETRPGAVLLLDEPDAHLHVILQDAVYGELRTAAMRRGSQLIVATHSEVLIDSVEPRELCIVLDRPRMAADSAERSRAISALRVLSNADVMTALETRGVLYVEGYTDIAILRAWADKLGHRAGPLLTSEVMWKKTVAQTRERGQGIQSREHYEAIRLARDDLPGVELLDGDARSEAPESEITGAGLQRLRWRRYEIESYLLHPDSLARYIEATAAPPAAQPHVDAMREYWRDEFPPAAANDPLGNHEFLNDAKARTRLLPPLLAAAGIHDLPYTRYHEIAALMLPGEIHPEVTEKLDAICRAFGVEP